MSEPTIGKKPATWKKILRRTLLSVAGVLTLLIVLAVSLIAVVWYRPQWILTPTRVSKLAGIALVTPGNPAPIPLSLTIARPSGWTRRFDVELAPGCYEVKESIAPGISFCSEKTKLAFSIRILHRKRIIPSLKLVALNEVDIVLAKAEIKPGPEKKGPDEEKKADPSPPAWMDFLSDHFVWGPLHLEAKEFRMGKDDMVIRAKLTNRTRKVLDPVQQNGLNSPSLDFDAGVVAKSYRVVANGKIEEQGTLIRIPEADAVYEAILPKNSRETPMKIRAKLNATYDLAKSLMNANFEAEWKNPNELVASIQTKKSVFTMDPAGLTVKSGLEIVLKGKTPAGSLPTLTLGVGLTMRNATEKDPQITDVKFDLDSYTFAGITAKSDLEVRMTTHKDQTDLELKRGELKIETTDFRKTVKALSRTSWAIPAPFAVLTGPITLKTLPFVHHADRLEIPVVLNSNLTSKEQSIKLETKAMVELSAKTLAPLKTSINVDLQNITLRVPDYDPLAPVPAYASDPRIIREEVVQKKEEKAEAKAEKRATQAKPSMPIEVTIGGKPDSIILLNRYFEPEFSGNANFKVLIDDSDTPTTGDLLMTTQMEIHYLNRQITLERLRFSLKPEVEFTCLVSMERAGYKITAAVDQRYGKTKITLGSVPALESDEIVSLLIYGMPKNSISSEQTQSVGSAQSAISSDALGVFSFFAFASTPIESVRYDSATQTYSAIVRLPGGVVASIGSSWDNDRQVSLSKSIGRNFAVSTEVIRDSKGVDRGGTLLRWRKSY